MRKILLLSVSAIISACTVGPDYKEPTIYEDKQIAESLKLNCFESVFKLQSSA